MKLTPLQIFWVFAVLLFILLIWLFKAVLLPFVLGGTIAYLLNPLVNKICKMMLVGEEGAAARWPHLPCVREGIVERLESQSAILILYTCENKVKIPVVPICLLKT